VRVVWQILATSNGSAHHGPRPQHRLPSECARLAELTDNQALRDDLVDLALVRMAEAERYDYSNVIAFPWR
jgi:hypothetical protein